MEHVRIKVNPNPWSESDKSWKLGTKELSNGGWTDFKWFPKSRCILDPKGFLTIPRYLYDTIFLNVEKPIILNYQ